MLRRALARVLRRVSTYDEWEHWNARSDPNASKGWADATLQDDLAYLREHLTGCREILEIGPGVGRTFPAHSRDSRITCYDITANYRDRLLQRAADLDLDVRLDVARVPDEPLPYEDNAFEAAVASQVFQHQRPERIAKLMAELVRVSGCVIAIASYGRTLSYGAPTRFTTTIPRCAPRSRAR